MLSKRGRLHPQGVPRRGERRKFGFSEARERQDLADLEGPRGNFGSTDSFTDVLPLRDLAARFHFMRNYRCGGSQRLTRSHTYCRHFAHGLR
jgi:hypothetical protein